MTPLQLAEVYGQFSAADKVIIRQHRRFNPKRRYLTEQEIQRLVAKRDAAKTRREKDEINNLINQRLDEIANEAMGIDPNQLQKTLD